MRKENVIFANLMDSLGGSYLAAVYLTKVAPSHSQINTARQPKKAKKKDTDKIFAYYCFTTTELDLEASTFKEAISNQNYAKDECFISSVYDFYRDNLLRADEVVHSIYCECVVFVIEQGVRSWPQTRQIRAFEHFVRGVR